MVSAGPAGQLQQMAVLMFPLSFSSPCALDLAGGVVILPHLLQQLQIAVIISYHLSSTLTTFPL
jgi:hypothetical protein